MDLFEWYSEVRKEYPPLNVLIHDLKNIYMYCVENDIMETRIEDLDDLQLPFNWHYIPRNFRNQRNIRTNQCIVKNTIIIGKMFGCF